MARRAKPNPPHKASVRKVAHYTNVNVKKVNNGYVISAHDEDYDKSKEMIAKTKSEAQNIANKLLKIK